jgi:hypothetical protein
MTIEAEELAHTIVFSIKGYAYRSESADIPANQGSLGAVSWYSPPNWAANILVLSIVARRTALQANWNASDGFVFAFGLVGFSNARASD